MNIFRNDISLSSFGINDSQFEVALKRGRIEYRVATQYRIELVDIRQPFESQKLLKFYFNNTTGKQPELLAVILQECIFTKLDQ